MSLVQGLAPQGPVIVARQRWFYVGAALFTALVTFVGFAPTFYLNALFVTAELSTLKVVHGVVFTGWIALFVAQTWLVAAGRRDIHRRLGALGALLLPVMCLMGYLVALDAGRRGFTPDPKISPLSFMAVPLFDLGVFVVLVAAALLLRGRSDWHKRLMLLATVSLLPPAIARVALQMPSVPVLPIAFGGCALVVLAVIVIDTVARRRLHPAMLWGGLFVLLSLPGRIAIAGTRAWQDFAAWLIA